MFGNGRNPRGAANRPIERTENRKQRGSALIGISVGRPG
jgi:hypothetical protein